MRFKRVIRWAVPVALLAAGAATASAQNGTPAPSRRPHIAPRTGYNFDSKDMLVGVQLTAPISGRFDFYPSTDVYFPDQGSRVSFNGDVRYRVPTSENLALYAGTGLNVTNRQVNGTSSTDPGMNLLGGLEGRAGWVHPFLEGKVTLRDRSFFQAMTGISISLGRP